VGKREKIMSQNTKLSLEKMAPLIGAKIIRIISGVNEFGETDFGFSVKTKTGKTLNVWILADDEGNGPGAIEIQDETITTPK
jgi:hypothetical protein